MLDSRANASQDNTISGQEPDYVASDSTAENASDSVGKVGDQLDDEIPF